MAFKLGMTVDLCMDIYIYIYTLLLVSTTLTQGDSWSKKAKNERWLILTTKQAISIKVATTVGHFLCDHDFENLYMAWSTFFFSPHSLLQSSLHPHTPQLTTSFILLSFTHSFLQTMGSNYVQTIDVTHWTRTQQQRPESPTITPSGMW